MKHLFISTLILGSHLHATETERFDLAKPAGEIDPQVREHTESKFTFTDDKSQPAGLQLSLHASRGPKRLRCADGRRL